VEGGLCAQYGRRSEPNRVIDRPRDACPEVGGLTSCGIVQIVADWAEERYPFYAYHPSRNLAPAKVRAFLDFLLASIARPTSGENVTARSPRKARRKTS
jgi:hypothetical protein